MKSTLFTTHSIRDLQSRLLIALLIGGYAPALIAAEETFFDRLKGFFSDTFKSTATEPPKDWALGCDQKRVGPSRQTQLAQGRKIYP